MILLLVSASCTQDINMNGSSMKALKDGVLWRPASVTATLATDGSLTISALIQNQSLTINTTAATAGTYIFGEDNINKITYISTIDGTDTTYVTGTGIGDGNITITEYDIINKTITGTFRINANTETVSPDVAPIVNFTQGGFYKIPITSGL